MATDLPTCQIHGKAPIVVYMCCRGAAGGKQSSPKKTAAVTLNARKPRKARPP